MNDLKANHNPLMIRPNLAKIHAINPKSYLKRKYLLQLPIRFNQIQKSFPKLQEDHDKFVYQKFEQELDNLTLSKKDRHQKISQDSKWRISKLLKFSDNRSQSILMEEHKYNQHISYDNQLHEMSGLKLAYPNLQYMKGIGHRQTQSSSMEQGENSSQEYKQKLLNILKPNNRKQNREKRNPRNYESAEEMTHYSDQNGKLIQKKNLKNLKDIEFMINRQAFGFTKKQKVNHYKMQAEQQNFKSRYHNYNLFCDVAFKKILSVKSKELFDINSSAPIEVQKSVRIIKIFEDFPKVNYKCSLFLKKLSRRHIESQTIHNTINKSNSSLPKKQNDKKIKKRINIVNHSAVNGLSTSNDKKDEISQFQMDPKAWQNFNQDNFQEEDNLLDFLNFSVQKV